MDCIASQSNGPADRNETVAETAETVAIVKSGAIKMRRLRD
jgi:hypothetical protein